MEGRRTHRTAHWIGRLICRRSTMEYRVDRAVACRMRTLQPRRVQRSSSLSLRSLDSASGSGDTRRRRSRVWNLVDQRFGGREGIVVREQTSAGGQRPFMYKSVPHSSGGDPLAHLCNAGSGPVDPLAVPWGWWYTIYKYDTATGALVGRARARVRANDRPGRGAAGTAGVAAAADGRRDLGHGGDPTARHRPRARPHKVSRGSRRGCGLRIQTADRGVRCAQRLHRHWHCTVDRLFVRLR